MTSHEDLVATRSLLTRITRDTTTEAWTAYDTYNLACEQAKHKVDKTHEGDTYVCC